jgi:hypothetical protein
MKQVSLFRPSESLQTNTNKTVQTRQKLEYHKNMTIKGKKNSKVKIIKNKTKHNYWGNIFRRKRIMSEYFSDAAFGSQSDTKKELYKPWEDQELLKKLRSKLILLQYEYDENEIIPNDNESNNKIAFMNDPNNFDVTTHKEKTQNE